MITLEHTAVMNLEGAMRGARNPMSSWARSDSGYDADGRYVLGENDLQLAERLCRAGSDHRKFIRQIFVSVDITAPMYWWKEFDTYKVGTVANSTSTMHKLHARPLSPEDFSLDKLSAEAQAAFAPFLAFLEERRRRYAEGRRKEDWYDLIQLLPSSYNQTRTVTMNYENLHNMYHARKHHKLEEWHVYCAWVQTLPYARELIIGSEADAETEKA